MKNDEPPASDPLVVSATLKGDDLELVLTHEGMMALEEMREQLREIDPDADFHDVLRAAMAALVEDLESAN